MAMQAVAPSDRDSGIPAKTTTAKQRYTRWPWYDFGELKHRTNLAPLQALSRTTTRQDLKFCHAVVQFYAFIYTFTDKANYKSTVEPAL